MGGGGGGGGDNALGCLVGALVFLPIIICGWVIWKVIDLVWSHPDETVEVLKLGALLLLAPHYVAAWVILYICRDLVVADWPPESSEGQERAAIAVWLLAIPAILAPGWLVLVTPLLAAQVGWGWASLLGALSTVTVTTSYFWIYWRRQPLRYQWARFEAQHQKIPFVLRSEMAFQWLKLKLAWLDFADK